MDGEPPPAPVAATTSDLQKLRAQLKVYKRTFKEMHGRMPQKEDIQHRPKILHLYKQYSALQKSTATVTEGAPRVKEQENRSTFEANSSSSHPGESTNLWLTRKDLPDDRGGSKNPRKRKGLGEFDGGRLDKVSNTVAHAHLKSKNRGKAPAWRSGLSFAEKQAGGGAGCAAFETRAFFRRRGRGAVGR